MTNTTNVATNKKETSAQTKVSTPSVEQKPDLVKELINRAIDIKGKKYVQVSDRVLHFNEVYPNGGIETKLISEPDSNRIVIKAYVTPDTTKPERVFTAYSQEVVGDSMINKTSALENAETSAVGRALGFMGIGVIEGIASADEVHKAQNNHNTQNYGNDDAPSEKQLGLIASLKEQKGWDTQSILHEMGITGKPHFDKAMAKRVIDFLLSAPSLIEAKDDVPFVGGGNDA